MSYIAKITQLVLAHNVEVQEMPDEVRLSFVKARLIEPSSYPLQFSYREVKTIPELAKVLTDTVTSKKIDHTAPITLMLSRSMYRELNRESPN